MRTGHIVKAVAVLLMTLLSGLSSIVNAQQTGMIRGQVLGPSGCRRARRAAGLVMARRTRTAGEAAADTDHSSDCPA